MAKAIIFDMDGVIVDTEPGYLYGVNKVLEPYGKQVTMEYSNQYFGGSSEVYWRDAIQNFDLDITIEEGIYKMNLFRRERIEKEGFLAIDGTIELISKLSQKDFPLAVASSSTMEQILEVVEELRIKSHFQTLISGADCKRHKPEPDVFLTAARKLDISPRDCLVIEDSANGITAAKRAGMKTIGFHNVEYGPSQVDEADYVVQTIRDITIEMCKKI